jgi:hypothetical protein
VVDEPVSGLPVPVGGDESRGRRWPRGDLGP